MAGRSVVLVLACEHKLARDLVAGGVFVPGESLPMNEECELVLRDAVQEIRVSAMVVFVNDDDTTSIWNIRDNLLDTVLAHIEQ